jgi:hypothetical protein
MDLDRYNKLLKNKREFSNIGIVSSIPNPNESDYKRGYIVRYFVQRANDESAFVYEISSKSYSSFVNNPLYSTVSLDWRLTGTPEQIKNSNFKSVKVASERIKALFLYLPNYLQFSKKLNT